MPIASRAGFVALEKRMALRVGQDRFFARTGHKHRSPALPDEQRQVEFDCYVELAPEATADQWADDTYPFGGKRQDGGNLLLVLERLGGDAQDKPALVVKPCRAPFGFKRRVIDPGGLVGLLNHNVCLCHAALNIATAQPFVGGKIAARTNLWRTWLHGLQRVADRRQDFVLDLDQVKRPPDQRFGFSRYQSNGLTCVHHPLARQHGVIQNCRAAIVFLAWNVGGSENCVDAREQTGSGGTDGDNARAGMGTTQDSAIQHPFHPEVLAVACSSRHLFQNIGIWHKHTARFLLAHSPAPSISSRCSPNILHGHPLRGPPLAGKLLQSHQQSPDSRYNGTGCPRLPRVFLRVSDVDGCRAEPSRSSTYREYRNRTEPLHAGETSPAKDANVSRLP